MTCIICGKKIEKTKWSSQKKVCSGDCRRARDRQLKAVIRGVDQNKRKYEKKSKKTTIAPDRLMTENEFVAWYIDTDKIKNQYKNNRCMGAHNMRF